MGIVDRKLDMDVEVARTFLEIVKTRSFGRSAERLFVTQTTVSARIQGLEQQLDCKLFVRSRKGARLTTAGERFVRYATQLVEAWDYAKREMALPEDQVDRLAVGCELSLWDPLMVNWLAWLDTNRPSITIRAEVDLADALTRQVERGMLDIAVVYSPFYSPGLNVELLMEEKLILVTTASDGKQNPSRYVSVSWGQEFQSKHDVAFPGHKNQGPLVGFGPLALQYILRVAGSGYFRTRAVEPYLAQGKLFRVHDAPEITYPVYKVFREREVLRAALSDLDNIINQATTQET